MTSIWALHICLPFTSGFLLCRHLPLPEIATTATTATATTATTATAITATATFTTTAGCGVGDEVAVRVLFITCCCSWII
jgi:hypothetical protein